MDVKNTIGGGPVLHKGLISPLARAELAS